MDDTSLALRRERARHEHARLALERVLTQCRRHSVEVLPVKGILTARRWYSDPGQRPIQDVDLRVRPSDLASVQKAGAEDGWQLLLRSPAYATLAFNVLGFLIEFESHVGPPGLCNLKIDDMLLRAQPRVGLFSFPCLEPELHDHALLLCVNAFKDKLINAVPGAIRDLELLPEQPGFSPAQLARLSQRSDAATIVWLVARWLLRVRKCAAWRAVCDALGGAPPRPLYTALFERLMSARHPNALLLRVLARAGADSLAQRARAFTCTALRLVE